MGANESQLNPESPPPKYLDHDDPLSIKLILLGDMSVGKTSLANYFITEKLPENGPTTTLAHAHHKTIEIKGRRIKLCIWDTGGQERFRALTRSYFNNVQGALFVYAISDKKTFESLPRWVEDLESHAFDNVVKIVIGNKVDEERQVSTADGKTFSDSRGSLFAETSVKLEYGVLSWASAQDI